MTILYFHVILPSYDQELVITPDTRKILVEGTGKFIDKGEVMDAPAIIVGIVISFLVFLVVLHEIVVGKEIRRTRRDREAHPEWDMDIQSYSVPVRYGYKDGEVEVDGSRYLYRESQPQDLHEAVVEVLVLRLLSPMSHPLLERAMANMRVRAASMAELEALRQANVGSRGAILALGSRWERRYGEEEQYLEEELFPRLVCGDKRIVLTHLSPYYVEEKVAVVRR